MPHDITTPVSDNEDLGHGNFLLEFECREMADGMDPAQFFMIGIPGSETLLRRPYSVCGLPGTFDERGPGRMQVLYKVAGQGTRLLAALRPGAPIHVLGPLGHGFVAPERPDVRPVFVAGGIGSAPFPAFAAHLAGHRTPPRMFYGARTAADLPLLGWFRERTTGCEVTTEDGSLGEQGRVTDPLRRFLAGNAADEPSSVHLYACGPEPMLQAVSRLAAEFEVTCDLSLEAHMACGFGVCLGCVVPVHTAAGGVGYDRVCVEGPVMRSERLAW